MPFILTSIYGAAGALVIGIPVGLLTAVFLSKVASSGTATVIRTAVQFLAGIPTVDYGHVGMIVPVPGIQKFFSLASGATKLETYFRVSIPAAKSGIATAVVLGVGRAIGEAMAIIMVSGNVANMPGLFRSVRFMTTAIASEMGYAAVGSLHQQALYSIGLVLFLFIMIINVILNMVAKKEDKA